MKNHRRNKSLKFSTKKAIAKIKLKTNNSVDSVLIPFILTHLHFLKDFRLHKICFNQCSLIEYEKSSVNATRKSKSF